ncbi:LPS export ABC transporter permease LptG [Pseudomonas agarici]|uniref:LPS export ABC transporter permease LptG n=1 Tax=Pseudomonas agarici TaxID=46677 RepID=A0A0X1T7Q2_PSEAA|nr:LPS export ABC transporter permease LptG [Pseudomonas agarici]AMB88091.1 LPS export ABC transporter permease LptG [Pseudomonas agarici]NWB92978.1 LPS export ABC transporter permease LptG [Pseudomonas agarici]NWC09245.1 LPS export ABC transporter permease LptG [Pseudomonas agarici]SEK30609.1 lipopolysaccharide export system permease protein [Pseudomonas agarici]
MKIASWYLIRNVLIGFVAAAALLLPLFTTFDLINELDDVTSGGYRWNQALLVVLMTLPRRAVDLSPFIALLGGIVGLGQLATTQELTAMRTAGISIVRIAATTVVAGLILVVMMGALDEWAASPLQQRGVLLRNEALAISGESAGQDGSIWARRGDEVARIGTMSRHNTPLRIEIFRYAPDMSLKSYVFADSANIRPDGTWLLKNAQIKEWKQTDESTSQQEYLVWQSVFSEQRLRELTLPTDSFSIRQLYHYIQFLAGSDQTTAEYEMAMWQKLGRPVLTLAMILFAVPFTFVQQRSPGLGGRLAIGALLGLLIYVSNQIIANLGLLFAGNVMLTTLLPAFVLLGIAMMLIHRFDRVSR